MNKKLADIALKEVHKFFHGNSMGSITNLKPITAVSIYRYLDNRFMG